MGRGTPATPRDSISRAQVASIEAPALAETNQRVFLGTGCFSHCPAGHRRANFTNGSFRTCIDAAPMSVLAMLVRP